MGKGPASEKLAAQGGKSPPNPGVLANMAPRDKGREMPAPHILAGQQTGCILLIPMMLYQHEVPWNLPIPPSCAAWVPSLLLIPHSHTVRTGYAKELCRHLCTVLSCPCRQPRPLSSWNGLSPQPWATQRVTSPPIPVALAGTPSSPLPCAGSCCSVVSPPHTAELWDGTR